MESKHEIKADKDNMYRRRDENVVKENPLSRPLRYPWIDFEDD